MGLSDRSTSGSRSTIACVRSRATSAKLGTTDHTRRTSPAVGRDGRADRPPHLHPASPLRTTNVGETAVTRTTTNRTGGLGHAAQAQSVVLMQAGRASGSDPGVVVVTWREPEGGRAVRGGPASVGSSDRRVGLGHAETSRLRSGEPFGGFGRWAECPVVGDLVDLVVADAQNLIHLPVALLACGSPLEPDDIRRRGVPHDARLGCGVRVDDVAALLEDRPGLIRPVSGRRLAPQPVAPLEASPFEVAAKQADEPLEVACGCGVVGVLHILRTDRAHANHGSWPTPSGDAPCSRFRVDPGSLRAGRR